MRNLRFSYRSDLQIEKKNNDDTFYYIEYEDDTRTVSFLLEIAEQLYTNLPDEKNVWVDNQSEYNLNDPNSLRIILLPFENTSTLRISVIWQSP